MAAGTDADYGVFGCPDPSAGSALQPLLDREYIISWRKRGVEARFKREGKCIAELDEELCTVQMETQLRTSVPTWF